MEFGSEADAQKSLKKLNNVEFNGRTLSVNQAGAPAAGGNNSFSGTPQSNSKLLHEAYFKYFLLMFESVKFRFFNSLNDFKLQLIS